MAKSGFLLAFLPDKLYDKKEKYQGKRMEQKMDRLKKILLTPARFAVDLGDGSERGSYVNQDYILQKMHRPHRGINLMYCYYPLDKGWPARARDAYADQEVSFAWDYPYDDTSHMEAVLMGIMMESPLPVCVMSESMVRM